MKSIKSGGKKLIIKDVIEFVKKYEGITYSEEVAKNYAQKAIQSLDIFNPSEAKDSLIHLVEFVINRKN